MAPNPNPVFATSTGAPVFKSQHEHVQVASDAWTLQLMQDVTLFDNFRHFSRERIPERVVHAKGAGAHGYFVPTADLSHLTVAHPFQPENLGQKIDVTARFSTVEHESGSADTVRTFRGFSVKLKTDVGNWDWVFINFPVFSIRDPGKLIGVIHAQGRDPKTHIFDPNRSYDNFSSNPEMIHQLLMTLSPFGVVSEYAAMNGYSVHPFIWVNKEGEVHYVRMRLETKKGLDTMSSARATELAGTDPDYHTRVLYDSIENQDFPRWTVQIQVMTLEQAKKSKFSPFDSTKAWQHGPYPRPNCIHQPNKCPYEPDQLFPFTDIGELVLTSNPQDYFSEIEQLAFSPGTLIPGILPSPDPLLQTRLFAYPDTQVYRLGVNMQQLPANRPKCPIANFQRNGFMTLDNQPGIPNYNSSIGEPGFDFLDGTEKKPHRFMGMARYVMSEVTPIDFVQPREFWECILVPEQKDQLVDNAVAALTGVDKEIQWRQLRVFATVSLELAVRIGMGLKLDKRELRSLEPIVPSPEGY